MKIIFFGPPGSGKGTQAQLLSSKLFIPHLSTGDILRQKLKEEDSISIELKEVMGSGNLVHDELLNKIVSNKLKSKECVNGFILDGYPRTMDQSSFLLSYLNHNNLYIDFIFDFKIDFKIVENRILKRAEEEKRSDDNIEVVKIRLEKYLSETFPVSEQFSSKFPNNYFDIDASREISQIRKELEKILKNGEK